MPNRDGRSLRDRWAMGLFGRYWFRILESLWFVPGSLVVVLTALGLGIVEVDRVHGRTLQDAWPRVFAVGPEGARALLTAVATSAITVAGTAFSITLVALSLASTQYSSRVLRNFMRDRVNQSVLGALLGIFAYCLTVLRTVRNEADLSTPTLSVLLGLLLGFCGIALLVLFIHHITTSIQASEILAAATRGALETVERQFPDAANCRPAPGRAPHDAQQREWYRLRAGETGYLQRLDVARLRRLAGRDDAVVRILPLVGDFIIEGEVIAEVSSVALPSPQARYAACWTIGSQRTLEQDIDFGLRQLVDVALKALSPGINDSTTAVMSVNYLTAVLGRLAERQLQHGDCVQDGVLRVILPNVDFATLLDTAYTQIRQNARGNVCVLKRLLWSIGWLAERNRDPQRCALFMQHARLVLDSGSEGIALADDREQFEDEAQRLLRRLQSLEGHAGANGRA